MPNYCGHYGVLSYVSKNVRLIKELVGLGYLW